MTLSFDRGTITLLGLHEEVQDHGEHDRVNDGTHQGRAPICRGDPATQDTTNKLEQDRVKDHEADQGRLDADVHLLLVGQACTGRHLF